MNKKFITAVLAAVVVASALSVPLTAQLGGPQMRGNLKFGLFMAENNLFEARMILRFKSEIGLTPEQEKKIENMMLAHEETAIKREADLKVMELHFAAMLKEEKVNRKEMEKMARGIGNYKTDLQIGHLNYLLDIRDVLNPEQIQKVENLKKQFVQHMRERFQERRQNRLPSPPQNP